MFIYHLIKEFYNTIRKIIIINKYKKTLKGIVNEINYLIICS